MTQTYAQQVEAIEAALQAHLQSAEVIELGIGRGFRQPVPAIICRDGTRFSVQAGEMLYCTPRSNTGPWTQVEVMTITDGVKPSWDTDDSGIGAWVDITEVAKEILKRGYLQITD